jgi:hypothetical protein
MAFVGIDFSLNSPAACILDSETYHFVSFFNYGKKWRSPVTAAFKVHEELIEIGAITGIPYSREVGSKDFLLKEREKMTDAEAVACIIDSHLKDGYAVQAFALEGFSYGSKGNSFIDMIQYNVHLRRVLINSYGVEAFHVFQPATVKKLAGKGNANKEYMFEAFKENVLGDKTLEKSPFWKWCCEKNFEKVPKPVDDLVDSYFILQGLLSNIIPLSQTS